MATSQAAARGITREIFIPHENGRGVFPGFISYIDAAKPVLLHRYGRIDASDAYDDYVDSISHDNGRTWSEPVLRQKSSLVEGGRMRYAEHAAWYDAAAEQLVAITKRALYPGAGEHRPPDLRWEIVIETYHPASDTWSPPMISDFGFAEGIAISFSFPIRTSGGRLLAPAQKHRVDQQGRRANYYRYRITL